MEQFHIEDGIAANNDEINELPLLDDGSESESSSEGEYAGITAEKFGEFLINAGIKAVINVNHCTDLNLVIYHKGVIYRCFALDEISTIHLIPCNPHSIEKIDDIDYIRIKLPNGAIKLVSITAETYFVEKLIPIDNVFETREITDPSDDHKLFDLIGNAFWWIDMPDGSKRLVYYCNDKIIVRDGNFYYPVVLPNGSNPTGIIMHILLGDARDFPDTEESISEIEPTIEERTAVYEFGTNRDITGVHDRSEYNIVAETHINGSIHQVVELHKDPIRKEN